MEYAEPSNLLSAFDTNRFQSRTRRSRRRRVAGTAPADHHKVITLHRADKLLQVDVFPNLAQNRFKKTGKEKRVRVDSVHLRLTVAKRRTGDFKKPRMDVNGHEREHVLLFVSIRGLPFWERPQNVG
jgi:hypothetical protein